jgi:hypothetical protein
VTARPHEHRRLRAELVIDGWRYFGYQPHEGHTDADMARGHAQVLLEVLGGEGFAQPDPRPMFPNPPGLLRLEPHSQGLRDRIWWGAASQRTAVWAAGLGMNLQSSTLINNESGKPFHPQQAEQIQAFREARQKAGHEREPRVSVSRGIFALVGNRDRALLRPTSPGKDRRSKGNTPVFALTDYTRPREQLWTTTCSGNRMGVESSVMPRSSACCCTVSDLPVSIPLPLTRSVRLWPAGAARAGKATYPQLVHVKSVLKTRSQCHGSSLTRKKSLVQIQYGPRNFSKICLVLEL